MKEQKEMTNTKNTETIIKKKQKSIIKDIGILRKATKRNLNKARKNIMKVTNLTYLLKQNSNLGNVRFVVVKIKGANLI